MDFKKIFEDLKNGKNNQLSNVIVVCLIGVMLVVAASFFKGNNSVATLTNKAENTDNTEKNNSDEDASMYKSQQEAKLKELLQSIQGVGNVKVIIYFDSGEEQVPAYNQNTSSSVTNEIDNSGGKRTIYQNSTSNTAIITNDGDKSSTMITKTNDPKVKGVLISAEGADDPKVRLNITNAVSDLFDISENKVNVLPMEKIK